MSHPRPNRVDHLIGLGLCACYVSLLLATAPALGLSRDESVYVLAAESYASWFELLVQSPEAAFAQSNIDRAFRVNNEHPGLVKSLFALSYLLDRKVMEATGGAGFFSRDSLAFRFVGMLSAGLLLWLIHIFGTRLYGRLAGLFAALAYALLPRPFYHAHLDAFDVPITLAVTAVTYAYYRSLTERRWALWTGVLFGLALATKHNSWLLPGIFAIHHAFCLLTRFWALRGGEPTPAFRGARIERVSALPYWLLSMALLGPVIFVASWPWLWNDTLARVGRYAAFHIKHEYYNMAYFGENYFWPPFPMSFPWVMTLYTVPATTLLLAVVGLTPELGGVVRRLRPLLRGQSDSAETVAGSAAWPAVLLLGAILAPLVVISMPWTPIFGGTKHWFTAYPFLALFAGLGFVRLLEVLRSTAFWEPLALRLRALRSLPALLGAFLLLPAAVETAHSHPFGLSHYTFAAGFVPGAADRGMNRQFWGFTTGSLVDFFAERLPRGGRVYVCDMTHAAFRMLARDGLLPPDIVPTSDIAYADFAIVHHEHHFAEVDHQIWSTYGTTQPVYVLTYDGVPIISVYQNPRSERADASPVP